MPVVENVTYRMVFVAIPRASIEHVRRVTTSPTAGFVDNELVLCNSSMKRNPKFPEELFELGEG